MTSLAHARALVLVTSALVAAAACNTSGGGGSGAGAAGTTTSTSATGTSSGSGTTGPGGTTASGTTASGTTGSGGGTTASGTTSSAGGGTTGSSTTASGSGGAATSTSSTTTVSSTTTSSTTGSGGGAGGAGPLGCSGPMPPGGTVEWTASLPVGGPGPDFIYCGSPPLTPCDPSLGTWPPKCCVHCPSRGGTAGVVVGTTGEAYVAVPWGTCGMPSAGMFGVDIFDIDGAGNTTGVSHVLPPWAAEQGTPPALQVLGIAGASHWSLVFGTSAFTLPSNGIATSTAATVVGSNNAEAFVPHPVVSGDAAGSTFFTLVPMGAQTALLQKLDATGAVAWTVPPLGSSSSVSMGVPVAADGAGGVYVGYSVSSGSYDFGCGAVAAGGAGLMRIGPSGTCMWQGAPAATPIPTASGRLYVERSASPTSTSVGELDPSTGASLWSHTYATTALGVQAFPGGGLLLTAIYSGTLDLGGGALHSVGTADLAVGVLSASGATTWSKSFGRPGATVALAGASADATGGVALGLTVTGGTVDFGGGPISGSVLVKLDAAGAFRWQEAPFAGAFAPDPCGAVVTAASCATCAPGGGEGVSVTKLAP